MKRLDKIKNISQEFRIHHSKIFAEFGPTARGVEWGPVEDVLLRYGKMLDVIEQDHDEVPSVLDVGCGYGGLYLYARDMGIPIRYAGIDLVESMIEYAKANIPDARFFCGDIFDFGTQEQFDYLVCNGILTQKLSASIMDMDVFANQLIKKMFSLAKRGIVFNIMTTKVNFMVSNLYYKNPIEMFGFCFTEITKWLRIDHSYPLYEYSVYLYKEQDS